MSIEMYANWLGENSEAVKFMRKQAAEIEALRAAAESIGALPEGYCFCSANRIGDDSKHHEPECAAMREALLKK